MSLFKYKLEFNRHNPKVIEKERQSYEDFIYNK